MDKIAGYEEIGGEIIDREDGELSDEPGDNGKVHTAEEDSRKTFSMFGDESAVPTISFSSETEIDRIIQEAQREMVTEANSNMDLTSDAYSGILPPPPPPPIFIRNMLDPEVLEQSRIEPTSGSSNIDELETLRVAALVSMKSNGLEEGEVREEPTTQRAEKNNASIKTRLSNADRQQTGTESYRRRPLSPSSRRNTRDSWSHRNDRNRRTRDRSAEPRKKKQKVYRSNSRDRRRPKDRDDRIYDEVSTPSISASSIVENATQLNPHHRPRSRRNDIEHQKLIFGGDLPSQSFPAPVSQNELHDNHDLVNMDVDSDNHTTAPVSPSRPRPSVEDESILRNILMEQLNTKKGKTNNTEESEVTEELDEKQHKENKKKLQECDQDIVSIMDELHRLDAKKTKMMKQLQETYMKLAEQQTKYWEKTKERDELRPLVDQYERRRILKMASDKDAIQFRRSIEEHEKQLNAIVALAHTSSIQSSPEVTLPVKQQPPRVSPQKGVQDMDLSLTPNYTAEEENEINLRQILLQKQQGKHVNGSQQKSAPNSANQTVEGPAEEVPSIVVVTKPREAPPLSPGPHTPVQEKSTAFEPRTPLRVRSPSFGDLEKTPEPINRKLQKYKRFGIPLRLYPHAGLELPCALEIERMICPFEMTGKCKDVDCLHRHLKDDQLKLREVVAMIVNQYPSLSGRFDKETYSSQIDYVLTRQHAGEGRREFLRRLLGDFVVTSGILGTEYADCNDYENAMFLSQVEASYRLKGK